MQRRMGSLGVAAAVLLCTVNALANAPSKTAKAELTWMGHAAWIIKTPGGATLLVDPWFTNPKAPKPAPELAAVDAILVTHGHFDHVGEAADLSAKYNAPVLGSYELVNLLGVKNGMGGNAGGTVKIKDATIHYTEAVHSSGYGKGDTPAQYGGAPLGFVISIDNGPVIYHAGDTDVFSSMALIGDRYHPTVALLPIGGHFTMDPAGAAYAVKLLKVHTIVPMHYGTFPALAGTPDDLRKELGKTGTKVIELKPGDRTEL